MSKEQMEKDRQTLTPNKRRPVVSTADWAISIVLRENPGIRLPEAASILVREMFGETTPEKEQYFFMVIDGYYDPTENYHNKLVQFIREKKGYARN
jgi:hypothetical protein